MLISENGAVVTFAIPYQKKGKFWHVRNFPLKCFCQLKVSSSFVWRIFAWCRRTFLVPEVLGPVAVHGDHAQSFWLLVPLFCTENTDNNEISCNSPNQGFEFFTIPIYFSVGLYLLVEKRSKRFRRLTPVQVPCCTLSSSNEEPKKEQLVDLGPPPDLQGDNRNCLL